MRSLTNKTITRTVRTALSNSSHTYSSSASVCNNNNNNNKDFVYQELFDLGPDKETKYKKLTDKYVKTTEMNGRKFLEVEPDAFRMLSSQAFKDIAHLLRPAHLKQVRKILDDPEATANDKFVALELLKNANIAANFILPGCQDTGKKVHA